MAAIASQGMRCVFEIESVVRGHHIYKISWTPVIGEELMLEAEDCNEHDKHAVAVMKDGHVVGHSNPLRVHSKLSRSSFLRLALSDIYSF